MFCVFNKLGTVTLTLLPVNSPVLPPVTGATVAFIISVNAPPAALITSFVLALLETKTEIIAKPIKAVAIADLSLIHI